MRTTPCLLLAACATTAPAGTTLIDETRVLNLFAQGNSDLGGDQNSALAFGADSNDDPFVPWFVSDSVSASGAQSAIATASAQFMMDIDPRRFAVQGNLSGSATILDETGHEAEGSASAMMQVRFSTDHAAQWQLVSLASGNAFVTLISGAAGPQIFAAGPGITDQTYLLGPGEYTLTFSAAAAAITFGVGTVQAESALNATFAMVPAPATTVLIALAPPLIRRRRS